jgi:putative transposase
MGQTVNCYDNAVTESFFHELKVELVHRERYITRRESQFRTFSIHRNILQSAEKAFGDRTSIPDDI